jgi:hypothetical protein
VHTRPASSSSSASSSATGTARRQRAGLRMSRLGCWGDRGVVHLLARALLWRCKKSTLKAVPMDILGIASQTWFPVVTLIIGVVLKAGFDALADRRAAAREREARLEQRLNTVRVRRADFQRSTLLELQESISSLMRYTGQSNHEDVVAYRKTGVWKKQYLTDEVDEGFRASQVNVSRLRVRVRDENIRELVELFSQACVNSVLADSELAAQSEMLHMASVLAQAHERIGFVLRSLDDDEDKVLD